jgi:hypothetical protein
VRVQSKEWQPAHDPKPQKSCAGKGETGARQKHFRRGKAPRECKCRVESKRPNQKQSYRGGSGAFVSEETVQ